MAGVAMERRMRGGVMEGEGELLGFAMDGDRVCVINEEELGSFPTRRRR